MQSLKSIPAASRGANCGLGAKRSFCGCHTVLISAAAVLLTVSTVISCANESINEDVQDRQAYDAASQQRSASPAPDGSYRLDTGDHVRIRFYDRYDRDDLNGQYVIGGSGQLRLPRIGVFDARHKTAGELETEIRAFVENKGEKLGYFSIDIVRCRPFYVTGLANHPGPYPYMPGLTVLEAVSIAGGLYRSPAVSATETMREKRTLIETMSRVAELIGRRARLQAERDDVASIAVPKELGQMDPLGAGEIIQNENAVLQRSRDVTRRERSGLESIIELAKTEADKYQAELKRLEQRIDEQTQIYTQLKKLHEDKVINQQRFFEAVIALDAVKRDGQSTTNTLAQANMNIEKYKRDLAVLTLANKARIAKEITDTEQEISRLKSAAAQTRQLMSGLDMLATQDSSGSVVLYKIMRRGGSGRLDSMQATESTSIMPGDVLKIERQPESAQFRLN